MCHRNTTEEYVFHYAPAAEHEEFEEDSPEPKGGDEPREEPQVRPADD